MGSPHKAQDTSTFRLFSVAILVCVLLAVIFAALWATNTSEPTEGIAGQHALPPRTRPDNVALPSTVLEVPRQNDPIPREDPSPEHTSGRAPALPNYPPLDIDLPLNPGNAIAPKSGLQLTGTDPNGARQLWSGILVDGHRTGRWTRWSDKTGRLIGLSNYDDQGNLVPPVANWHENGQLKAYYTDSLDGRLTGRAVLWYPDGKKKCELQLANNTMNGWCTWWNQDGSVDWSKTGRYRDGVLE
jgi:hypothetical protein